MHAHVGTQETGIPGPREPAIIQTLRFLHAPVGYAAALEERYGAIVGIRLVGTGEMVYVTRPDLVKRVLNERETFENYAGDEILTPLIGANGVILLSGETHLRRRRLVSPPFHGEQLRGWTDVIAEVADRELERLPREIPVAVRETMQRITIEVICRVVFGVEDPAELERFYETIAGWSNPRFSLPLMFPRLRINLGSRSPWGALLKARADMDALLDELITSARRRPNLESRTDVLSILVAAVDEDGNPGYTHEELRDELLGLLFAGQDTTASALAWSCVLLAEHPTAFDQLAQEESDGGTAWADAIGKETLRLRPSLPAAGRLTTCDTTLDGVDIPAGTRLVTLTLGGYDADNFPAPAAFRPERWLADPKPPAQASTPFGGGAHRCLGASLATVEMREVLQALARTATRLSPAPGRPDRLRSYSAVLVPSRGGRVMIGHRPVAPSSGAPDTAADG